MFIATNPRTAIVDQNIQHEVLVETLNLRELEVMHGRGCVAYGSRFYLRQTSAFDLHAAKAANVDRTIGAAAPRAAPEFKLRHFGGAMTDKVVNDILLAQPVATGYSVVKMVLEAIMILCNGCGTAFCGHGVAAHGINF